MRCEQLSINKKSEFDICKAQNIVMLLKEGGRRQLQIVQFNYFFLVFRQKGKGFIYDL